MSATINRSVRVSLQGLRKEWTATQTDIIYVDGNEYIKLNTLNSSLKNLISEKNSNQPNLRDVSLARNLGIKELKKLRNELQAAFVPGER